MCISVAVKVYDPPVDRIELGWGNKIWDQDTIFYKVVVVRGMDLFPLIYHTVFPFDRGKWQAASGPLTEMSTDGIVVDPKPMPLGFHCFPDKATAKLGLKVYRPWFSRGDLAIVECKVEEFVAIGYQTINLRLDPALPAIVSRRLFLPKKGLTFNELLV